METEKIQVRKTEPGPGEVENKISGIQVAAIVPLRGRTVKSIDMNETLVRKCAESVRQSRYIESVIISADEEDLFKMCSGFGNVRKILRPGELSGPGVRVGEVLKYTVEKAESEGFLPDIAVPLEITYPFRPEGLLDGVVEMLALNDFDTVIAGVPEYRICWKKEGNEFKAVTDFTKNRSERIPLHVGLPGLACAVYPRVLKTGKRYGVNLGIYETEDPFASVEVRTRRQLEYVAERLYWAE